MIETAARPWAKFIFLNITFFLAKIYDGAFSKYNQIYIHITNYVFINYFMNNIATLQFFFRDHRCVKERLLNIYLSKRDIRGKYKFNDLKT